MNLLDALEGLSRNWRKEMRRDCIETVEIVTVTPAMANRWFTLNSDGQRNLSPKTVNHYARPMRENRWMLSNDAIVFDINGRLINGQHRLNAVIQSNKPQRFIVGRNFDPDSFVIMDRQTTRRTQQFIKKQHRNTLAGASYFASLWYRGEFPKPQFARVEPVEALEILKANETMEESANFIHESGAHRIGKVGFLAFLHWFYAFEQAQDRTMVDSFFLGIATGEGLRKGDPALTFRNRVTLGAKTDMKTFQAMAIKAITAHIQGKKMNVCRWSEHEEFPALELR